MMRTLLFGLLISLAGITQAQTWHQMLSGAYEDYLEATITNRRFKHRDIEPLIAKTVTHPEFLVKTAGYSVQGRPIYLVRAGHGPHTILLWSQMHGDESTATMAIMDLFNFLTADDDFNSIRENIFNNLTIYLIPMLNPDGAEQFTRRNAYDIDINRDALRLTSPEARILKQVRDSLQPEYGFNLHDQNRYTSVGLSGKTATISFLAPAFDWDKSVNPVRKRALQLIVSLNGMLQSYLPGQVAKYDDTFEPRAFGDNIQKWGTSTVLIECGGQPGDPEKQIIRKMNFLLFLTAFESIGSGAHLNNDIKDYFDKIPQNARYLHELIIRNGRCQTPYGPAILDIGFAMNERDNAEATQFSRSAYISDLGDLSTYAGYEELNAEGYSILPGQLYIPNDLELRSHQVNENQLMEQGYLWLPLSLKSEFPEVKYMQWTPADSFQSRAIQLGQNPGLILILNGRCVGTVINGTWKKNE
ncbi:MAG: M14 family zinc carboxypeptidase [Saprospiraceae bacterium]